MHEQLSRREFLVGSGALLLMAGCGLTAAEIFIPAIAGVTLQELYNFAKSYFSGSFSSGEVLSGSPGGMPDYQKNIDPSIQANFASASAENQFCTPVSILRHGGTRYIQLAEPGSLWSLVTGGQSKREVFNIHNTWLEWLVSKDNCNLTFNGHSIFEQCGIDNCPIYVTRQEFLAVDGKAIKLIIDIPSKSDDNRQLFIHKSHWTEWRGCPDVKGEPEQCVA
jgi:hypothetical protein